MEDRQNTRSPHAREPKHRRLERQARPTRSRSGTPASHTHALQGDTYQLPNAPLLSRDEELALARDIEALEIAHWGALLSFPPALPTIALAATECLSTPCPALQDCASAEPQPLTSAKRQALATALRELDSDRTALQKTDTRVLAAWQDEARARAYLARLHSARTAQHRAKAHFVASNLRLVVRMSRAYDNGLLDRADLIQEGTLGLMRAVERYDHRRGLRFSTYASWWIRHYLNRSLADKGRLIRVPVHAVDTHRRLQQARRKYITQYGAAPTAAQVAELAGLPLEVVDEASPTIFATPRSLDRPVRDDSEQTMHDMLADPDQPDIEGGAILANRVQLLADSLHQLTSFEAAVLRFRYGLDGGEELTLREVGEKYHLSRERIRQVQEVALAKLRSAFEQRASDPASASAVA
jgi:RNA polymerase primary sigma factor